jgi:hypothetical protein
MRKTKQTLKMKFDDGKNIAKRLCQTLLIPIISPKTFLLKKYTHTHLPTTM